MFYTDLCTHYKHSDDVEAVFMARRAVAGDPHQSGATQLPLLLPVDCLDRIPEVRPGPGLHLHERYEALALCDDVYVAVAVAEPPVAYGPALPHQPARRYALAKLTEFLVV